MTPPPTEAELREYETTFTGDTSLQRSIRRLCAAARERNRLAEALEVIAVVNDPAKCFQQPTLRGIAEVAKRALEPSRFMTIGAVTPEGNRITKIYAALAGRAQEGGRTADDDTFAGRRPVESGAAMTEDGGGPAQDLASQRPAGDHGAKASPPPSSPAAAQGPIAEAKRAEVPLSRQLFELARRLDESTSDGRLILCARAIVLANEYAAKDTSVATPIAGPIALPVRAVVDEVNPKNLGWWVIESTPVAIGRVGERWGHGLPESAARQIAAALNATAPTPAAAEPSTPSHSEAGPYTGKPFQDGSLRDGTLRIFTAPQPEPAGGKVEQWLQNIEERERSIHHSMPRTTRLELMDKIREQAREVERLQGELAEAMEENRRLVLTAVTAAMLLGGRERLEGKAEELDAELTALRERAEDGARLNWLEANAGAVGFCSPGGGDPDHWLVSHNLANEDPITHGRTLREAIDAARSQPKSEEGKV